MKETHDHGDNDESEDEEQQKKKNPWRRGYWIGARCARKYLVHACDDDDDNEKRAGERRKKTRREIICDLIKGYFTCSKIQWTMFGGARTKSKRKQPTTTTMMMIGKTVYDNDHPRSIE